MLRAEIAHVACEQIARGGLVYTAAPPPHRDPMRWANEPDDAYRARCNAAAIAHIDLAARIESTNTGNRETCQRAATWLREAGDHATALAVEAHIRQQWGHST